MNDLRIISGQNVDLICPFPLSEIKRTYGWIHCYRTVSECDDSPKDIDSYCAMTSQYLPRVVSYGIIDKNHLTNIKHEAPLVGFVSFEPSIMPNGAVRNGFLHVATARRAWKANLIDEAGQLVLRDLFEGIPSLLRVSAVMSDRNAPAKGLVKRLGFKFEGVTEDAILVDNSPQNMAQFGLTRRNYNLLWPQQSAASSEASLDRPEVAQAVLETLPQQE